MDERIIALLQKRDESALQYIREAYGSLCLGLAVRILGNEADAEECLNDMLLDVWNQIPPDEPEYLRAYLLTIVRRRAVNRLKLENAKKRGGTQFTVALDELSELLPSGENVEHVVDQRALNHALEAFSAHSHRTPGVCSCSGITPRCPPPKLQGAAACRTAMSGRCFPAPEGHSRNTCGRRDSYDTASAHGGILGAAGGPRGRNACG